MAKFTRRDMLIGGAAALAATTLPAVALPDTTPSL